MCTNKYPNKLPFIKRLNKVFKDNAIPDFGLTRGLFFLLLIRKLTYTFIGKQNGTIGFVQLQNILLS